jgi:Zn finger protein HypA/HybF involved in hydrogenase expression
MFSQKNGLLSRDQMVAELEKIGATCKLCTTTPKGFVYQQRLQSAWCPRCGMPPIPVPDFMKGNDK